MSVCVVDVEGTKQWHVNDVLHREDGPAVEYADGAKIWYVNGRLHRLDGPAIEYADGTKVWYANDQLHRTDGPAVEYPDGRREWWIDGECIPPSVAKRLVTAEKENAELRKRLDYYLFHPTGEPGPEFLETFDSAKTILAQNKC
jgi:hypothetical protein